MNARSIIRPALVTLLGLTLLTGVAYPLAVTGLAALLPAPAPESLVGQEFTDPGLFWSRPSATSPRPYTAFEREPLGGSSGSNLAPSNPALAEAVTARVQALAAADAAAGVVRAPGARVPADLVTASASGLDPHITPAAAEWQLPRVAKVTGLPESQLRALVSRHTAGRQWGILGEPRVDVTALNRELLAARAAPARSATPVDSPHDRTAGGS